MKKIIYIILSTIMGLLLSFLFHAGIEFAYIIWAYKNSVVLTPYLSGACFLPPWLSAGLLILGFFGGIALGFWWWDIIYVKRLRDKAMKR